MTGWRANALDHVEIEHIHPVELANLAKQGLREMPLETSDEDALRAMAAQLSVNNKRITPRLKEPLLKALRKARRENSRTTPGSEA